MSEKKPKFNPSVAFTQKIIELSDANWADDDTFQDFVDFMGLKPGEAKVDFLQRLLALIKRISPSLINQETKDKIIEAGKNYLDKAIEEEEQVYADEAAKAEQEEEEQ